MKTLHIVTATECRAAKVGAPFDIVADWPSVPAGKASHYVWAIGLDDVQEGDVRRLCGYLKIQPERLILLDPYGSAEISLPADALACRVVRSTFRSYETERLVALPPIVGDLAPAEDSGFVFDTSYLVALATGRETQTYNALKRWTPNMLKAKPSESSAYAAARAFVADNTERQADGTFRTLGTAFKPETYIAPALEHDRANRPQSGQRTFKADVRAFNDLWKDPTPLNRFGGAPEPPLDKENRPLVTAAFGPRLITRTGEVPAQELRFSLSRSRSAVAVSEFLGGAMPLRAVQAAALGRMVFCIGEFAAPFGIDVSDWCHVIPAEQADDAGLIIDAKVRHRPDDEIRAAGRAARAWFDRVASPSAWAARLSEVLP